MKTKIQPFQINRPWGHFRQFCQNTPATVKILTIKPNEKLSLQSHAKREEFWRVIFGGGVAEIGRNRRKIKIGAELVVPKVVKQPLTAGPQGLAVLEISFGRFAENDITRYEDKYGRI